MMYDYPAKLAIENFIDHQPPLLQAAEEMMSFKSCLKRATLAQVTQFTPGIAGFFCEVENLEYGSSM